ncbi:MAG TPA: SEC-C metal-binding domain-containing protein [Bryobacteraceae bacterium]
MSTAAATALQLDANRANSLLSTGPRTESGKLASSRNSLSHGLTTRDALLPNEDPLHYQQHHAEYLDHYRPADPLDTAAVTELADLQWRLRRVPVYEAQLMSLEIHRLQTDAALKPLIEGIESESQILALAFRRLVETKVLTNLLNLESRLARRVDKLQTRLEAVMRDRLDQEKLAQRRRRMIEAAHEMENRKNEANSSAPATTTPKVGRNESCPCGSGLKFKRCCLGGSSTTATTANPPAQTAPRSTGSPTLPSTSHPTHPASAA